MHYRRKYSTNLDNNFEKFDKGFIQYFSCIEGDLEDPEYTEWRTKYKNIEHHCFNWSTDKCGIMDDLIEFLETQYPQYLENEKEVQKIYYIECLFVCKWDVYIELAKFIYDYIKFINDKYELDWDEKKWYEHILDKFLNYNQKHHPKADHDWEHVIESDGSLWYDIVDWGTTGWNTVPYIKPNKYSKLYRVYSYNIEFLVSMFIYNHDNFRDPTNAFNIISI